MNDPHEMKSLPQFQPLEEKDPSLHGSSYEYTLEHWLEVHWLVEEEYQFAKDADREVQM